MPDVPAHGPCDGESGRRCRIAVDHWRERVTGPEHPLLVVRCGAHGRAFTVYPPGHVPYGRQRLVRSAPDGRGVLHGEGEAWRQTLFEAAVDGARGVAWPHADARGRGRDWSKQVRHIERGAWLCGVAPAVEGALRLMLAEALAVDLLTLSESAASLGRRPGYRTASSAVIAVLKQLERQSAVFERLAVSGHLVGLWGRPQVWEAGTAQLRTPFRHLGTPPPPGGT